MKKTKQPKTFFLWFWKYLRDGETICEKKCIFVYSQSLLYYIHLDHKLNGFKSISYKPVLFL